MAVHQTAAGKARTIALVLNPAYHYDRQIIRGITAFAGASTTWSFRLDWDARSHTHPFAWGPPLGVIGLLGPEFTARLRQRGIAAVDTSTPEQRDTGAVHLDDAAIGRLAAEHLLALGPRSLAVLRHTHHLHGRRSDAFVSEVVRRGGSAPPVRLCQERDEHLLVTALQEWLKTAHLPLSVFCTGDLHAIGLLRACQELGLYCPDEVAILGVDNDEHAYPLDSRNKS